MQTPVVDGRYHGCATVGSTLSTSCDIEAYHMVSLFIKRREVVFFIIEAHKLTVYHRKATYISV